MFVNRFLLHQVEKKKAEVWLEGSIFLVKLSGEWKMQKNEEGGVNNKDFVYQDLNSQHSFVPRKGILPSSCYMVCLMPGSSPGNYDVIWKYRLAKDLHNLGNNHLKKIRERGIERTRIFFLFFYNFYIRKRDLPTKMY